MAASTAFILAELKDAYNERPIPMETSIDSFESIVSSRGGSTVGTFETRATSETKETMKMTNVSRGNETIPVHHLLTEARCDVEKANCEMAALENKQQVPEQEEESDRHQYPFQTMRNMISNALGGCGCMAADLGIKHISDEEIIAAIEQQYEAYDGTR